MAEKRVEARVSTNLHLITTLQPKVCVTLNYTLPPAGVHTGHNYPAHVLESPFIDANSQTNRFASRVLDPDPTDSTVRAVDAKLSYFLATYPFAVDYYAAGTTAEAADAKVNALNYPHGRSTIINTSNFADQGVSICAARYCVRHVFGLSAHPLHSVDVILATLDIAEIPVNLDLFPTRTSRPSGVAMFLVRCQYFLLVLRISTETLLSWHLVWREHFYAQRAGVRYSTQGPLRPSDLRPALPYWPERR